MLVNGCHPAEEPQNFNPRAEAVFQKLDCFANFPLRGHEDENVTLMGFTECVLGGENSRHHMGRGVKLISGIWGIKKRFRRRITNFHRPESARNLNDRGPAKSV